MTGKPIDTYPTHAVECTAGDHLIHREVDGRWKVFRVDDLVQLERLVPLQTDAGTIVGLIDEASTLDSVSPAYRGEVYLLLSAFDEGFASSDDARRAVQAGTLGPAVTGLYRKLGDFPRASSLAVRQAKK